MKTHRAFTAFLAALGLTATTAFSAPYTNWQNDYTGSESNTLLLWKFDSPTYGLDSSSGGHDASFSPSNTTTGVAGKFGDAFLSSPTSTANDAWARNIASSNVFNGSALSVEFWYKPLSNGAESRNLSYFFDKRYTNNAGIQLALNNVTTSGKLAVAVGNGTNTFNLSTGTLGWTADQWYHIAVTYENVGGDGTINIFRDGVIQATATSTNFGNLAAGANYWQLANRLGSSYGSVSGYYDNFRISDVAYDYAIPEPGIVSTLLLAGSLFAFLLKWKRHAK